MKRILSMLLVLCMVISMLPLAVFAAETETLKSVSGEAVTTSGYTFTYTAESAGTLTVTAGDCSPGWRYKVYGPNDYESIYLTKWSTSHDHDITAGEWTVVFYAYSSSAADNVDGTVSFDITFTPTESGEEEIVKEKYEVSETALALGDNSLTLLDTAVTTVYVFEPDATGTYKFTGPSGAIVGYWGAGTWFLSDPGSTSNTCEWTITSVGQSACIGVSGVSGQFTLNVAKTADYQEQVIHEVTYENKATLSQFSLPSNAVLGAYVDVSESHTAVLGSDGYYHLDSTDGAILLIDMDYNGIVLTDALKSDRPVMYAYVNNEDGSQTKYDIGAAVQAYEAVTDSNGYYPLTSDLIFFYDTYATSAGVWTYHVTSTYDEDTVWMYCCRTMTLTEAGATANNPIVFDSVDTLVAYWQDKTVAADATVYVQAPLGGVTLNITSTQGAAKIVDANDDNLALDDGAGASWTFTEEAGANVVIGICNQNPYDSVQVTLSVPSEGGDEDTTSGTVTVAGGESSTWTAPASGSVTFTFDPSDAGAGIGQNDVLVSENETGTITLDDVTKGDEYDLISIDGTSFTASWAYSEASDGGDEGGDDTEITYADLTIGNNQINAADAHWSYTAASAGTLNLSVGGAVMGAVEITYTVNDGEVKTLTLESNVDLTLAENDVVKIDVTAAGYATLTAAWSGESAGGDEITYTDLVIGNNQINAADAHWSYTAASAGTLNLSVGAAVMGAVEITYTVNDGEVKTLALESNVDLTLAENDVVKIDVTAAGYATLTAAWSGESTGGDDDTTTITTLVLGDNELSVPAGLSGGTWTWTATEAGTLTVTVTELAGSTGPFGMAFYSVYSLVVNEVNAYSETNTATVTAGQTVTVQLYTTTGEAFDATVNLSFTAGTTGGETTNPYEGFEGTGTEADPFIIESLEEAVTLGVAAGDDVYYKYIAEKDGTITYTDASCDVWTIVDGDNLHSVTSAEVSEGDTVLINVFNGAGSVTVAYAAEPDGSETNPYIITEFPSETTVTLTDDNASSGVWYQYTATEASKFAADFGGFVNFKVNGSMVYWVNEVAANDVILINVGSWDGAGNYTLKLYDPSVAMIGEVVYTDISTALSNAQAGETIKLIADVEVTSLTLMKGVTLDLNGHKLTATQGAVAIKGNAIIDSKDGVGQLIVGQDALVLDEANGQIPVWNGNGYWLVNMTFNYRTKDVTSSGATYGFLPVIANTDVRAYVYENFATTGLSVTVSLTWTSGGSTVVQNFIYSADTAIKGFNAEGKGALTLTVSGLDNIDAITAIAVVASTSDAEASAPTALSMKP